MKSVLVTGGAGFIGSHLVDALLSRGCEVGVLDDFSTGTESNLSPNLNRVRLHRGSITDRNFTRIAVSGYGAVLHDAARVNVTHSVEDPVDTNHVNVEGTLNLLEAARDSGVQTFVYASSSSVYGETEKLPKEESMPPMPVSPYAVSKLAGENYCKVFSSVYGLKTVSLRYFNVYGPRQKSGPYSGVIPAFVKGALAGERLVISGDGTQTRDFVYVKDVVRANLLCLDSALKGGEVYNVGSNQRTSINEVARLVYKLTGNKNTTPNHVPPRRGDVLHSYADITRISSELGYEPSYTIESGLMEVVEWWRSSSLVS